jgi:hypothetical protein
MIKIIPRSQESQLIHLVTTLEHHGPKMPDAVFEQHSKVLFEELVRELGLRPSPQLPLRSEPRTPYSGVVEIVPFRGSLRNLRFRCHGLDISPRGLGLLSMFPMECMTAKVTLEDQQLISAQIVRCRERKDLEGYELGLSLLDGNGLPLSSSPHMAVP